MLRQTRSSKKKKKKKKFPFLGCFILLVAIVAFVGIGGGLYSVINGNLFVANPSATPINLIEQLGSDTVPISTSNPSATPINIIQPLGSTATSIPVAGTNNINTVITPDIDPSSQTFRDILNDMNAARAGEGLNPVRLNSQLNSAAAVQAVYNAEIGRLDHASANGDSVGVRVSAQGYQWSNVGENLLYNWTTDGHVAFNQWRNSPGHNANMMNGNFTEMGLAYIATTSGQVYQAMVLARPR